MEAVQRFEADKLIRRTKQGYEVTDRGFYNLIASFVLARKLQEARETAKRPARKYPGEWADKTFGSLLRPRLRIDLEKRLLEHARKPNCFVICRTDADGKIAWTSRYQASDRRSSQLERLLISWTFRRQKESKKK